MKLGIEYLGGVNYLDVIERHHPETYAAGFLMKASGWKNGIGAARALLETGKCDTIRCHFLWDDNHLFTEKDIDRAVVQARKLAKLKEKFPDVTMYASPFLEPGSNQHPTPIALLREVKRACKNVLPKEIKVVTGRQMPRGISECHGTCSAMSGKYIYSFDGDDMLDDYPNGQEYRILHHKRHEALILFGWTALCNGKKFEKEIITREERVERGLWLKKKQINEMARMLSGCS